MANGGLYQRPSPVTGARSPSEILELYGRSPERGMGEAARRSAGPNSGTIADLLERIQGQSAGTAPIQAPPQQGGSFLDNIMNSLQSLRERDRPTRSQPRTAEGEAGGARRTQRGMPAEPYDAPTIRLEDLMPETPMAERGQDPRVERLREGRPDIRGRSLGSPQDLTQPEPVEQGSPPDEQSPAVDYLGTLRNLVSLEALPNETEISDRDLLEDMVTSSERAKQQGQGKEQTKPQEEEYSGIMDHLMNNPDVGRTLLDFGTSLMASDSPYFLQAMGQAGQETLTGLDEREARELEKQFTEAQIAESKARSKQMDRGGQEITQDSEGRFVRIDQDGNAEFVTMSGIPIRGATKQAGIEGMEDRVADFYKSLKEGQAFDVEDERDDQQLLEEAIRMALSTRYGLKGGTSGTGATGTAQ